MSHELHPPNGLSELSQGYLADQQSSALQIVDGAFAAQIESVGYLVPGQFAEQVLPGLPSDNPVKRAIAEAVLWHPTRDHLYRGAEETLDFLLQQGDSVRVWTDDYPERVQTSGLTEALRSRLPETEHLRFDIARNPDGSPVMDKFPLLSLMFSEAKRRGISAVAITDNSQKNMNKAALVAHSAAGANLRVNLFTVDSRAPEDYISPEFSLDNIRHRIIGHIASLGCLREGLLASSVRHTTRAEQVMWVVDFNETLLDTAGLEASLRRWVAQLIIGNYDDLIGSLPAVENKV